MDSQLYHILTFYFLLMLICWKVSSGSWGVATFSWPMSNPWLLAVHDSDLNQVSQRPLLTKSIDHMCTGVLWQKPEAVPRALQTLKRSNSQNLCLEHAYVLNLLSQLLLNLAVLYKNMHFHDALLTPELCRSRMRSLPLSYLAWSSLETPN